MRLKLFELSSLAVGTPSQIAKARVLQMHAGNLLEVACRVEAGGDFVGERLIVNKTVGAGRADGLLVKPLGVELAAFEGGDLGGDQSRAVRKVLRAVLGPFLELAIMGGQCI